MSDHTSIVHALLLAIGEDPTRDGLVDTPSRVVKSWAELFAGYKEDPSRHLRKTFDSESDQLIQVNGIEFHSMCEHHMLPFFGTVDVAYIPKGRVVGLSKFARLVDGYSRRLQIQERLTAQVADAIEGNVATLGVAVRVRSQHLCMIARGARCPRASMTTTALRGVLKDSASARAEWLQGLPA